MKAAETRDGSDRALLLSAVKCRKPGNFTNKSTPTLAPICGLAGSPLDDMQGRIQRLLVGDAIAEDGCTIRRILGHGSGKNNYLNLINYRLTTKMNVVVFE